MLQDENTASSGEAALLAFRGLPGVRTIGSGSAGYASANATVPLPDGATMLLTTALFVDRAGREYGDRIPPDQPTTEADPAVRAWLRERCR